MQKYGELKKSPSGVSRKWFKSKRRRRKERKKERAKVGNNNGQLRIANVTSGGASKATWAKTLRPHEIMFQLKSVSLPPIQGYWIPPVCQNTIGLGKEYKRIPYHTIPSSEN